MSADFAAGKSPRRIAVDLNRDGQLLPEQVELRVELKGALAGILALAGHSKKPATGVREGLR